MQVCTETATTHNPAGSFGALMSIEFFLGSALMSLKALHCESFARMSICCVEPDGSLPQNRFLWISERGVVWEETIILLPDNVHYVFLSATIPNARQFAEWICHLHKQVRCSIHYLFQLMHGNKILS